jgi:hypothetical protein
MKKLNLMILMLLLISSGCTFYGVDAQEIVMAPFGQNKQTNIEIQYLETVTVPYEVIGHVTVNTERRNSIEEVIEKMKRQVSMLGGDAVTNIIQTDKPSPIAHIRTVYTGTVIIFK